MPHKQNNYRKQLTMISSLMSLVMVLSLISTASSRSVTKTLFSNCGLFDLRIVLCFSDIAAISSHRHPSLPCNRYIFHRHHWLGGVLQVYLVKLLGTVGVKLFYRPHAIPDARLTVTKH